MRISTKGRYAVTAMMDLAIRDRYGPVRLAEISRCQGISLSYLEQLFARLRRSGLVIGVRGPGGGYRLARSKQQITIADIIRAVDERLDQNESELVDGLPEDGCLTKELWCDLSQQIVSFLEGITLADFLERPSVRALVERQDASRRQGASASQAAAA